MADSTAIPTPGMSGDIGPDPASGLKMLLDRVAAAGKGLAGAIAPAIGNTKAVGMTTDQQYIEFFDTCKRQAMADRWIFERQWTRALHYLNLRQWLAPFSRTEGWRDARIGKGVPKPCTSKPKEIDQSIRSMFASIRFGVIVRPNGSTTTAITTAATADDLAPLLHDVHQMDVVMNEGDFWLVNLGNTVLHSYWDEDRVYGFIDIPFETCATCQKEYRGDIIANSGQKCPACGGTSFVPAKNPDGTPKVEPRPKGAPVSEALSPFELAFPLNRPAWAKVPYVIRMRWRSKHEFEENPKLAPLIPRIQWQKGSSERSLQIFQSLALQNDIPTTRLGNFGPTGSVSSSIEDGVAEYELWHRPTNEHPDGLVLRVFQDSDPIVYHDDDQGLPGPIPYKDAKGNPLFTFTHAGYQQVGGRVIASGVHEPVIQKYDQLNRLDSLIEMIAMRTASPQWMIPKGAETAWLGNSPGVPGLILQWNAQTAGQAGRPELIPGIPPDSALMSWRKMILEDIEEATGTYDILRGTKPSGVEAFSAMQLLVEAGQRRFSSAFQARGNLYKDWYGFAIELERQFGPDERTLAVMSPTKSWKFQTFKKADLRGDVTIVVEDGTVTPKTSLGERAAIEHLNQLGFLDKGDADQRYTIFQKFGLTTLVPALDAQVQAALKKQEDFEQWIAAGAWKTIPPGTNPHDIPGYPLKWHRWYDPQIHRSEFLKWANSDKVQQMLAQMPQAEGLLEAHLLIIDQAIIEAATGQAVDPNPETEPPAPPPGPPQPGAPAGAVPPPPGPPAGPPPRGAGRGAPPPPRGAGRAMRNSNQNSASLGSMPGNPGGPAPPA